MSLKNKTILITGGAHRLGRHFALTAAQAGADIILHHSHSPEEARQTALEIEKFGVKCKIISVDFSDPEIIRSEFGNIFQGQLIDGLVNSAAIFEPVKFADTTLLQWQKHMNINLTAPFLLAQLFAENLGQKEGRIVNIVDWRALRPGRDHPDGRDEVRPIDRPELNRHRRTVGRADRVCESAGVDGVAAHRARLDRVLE